MVGTQARQLPALCRRSRSKRHRRRPLSRAGSRSSPAQLRRRPALPCCAGADEPVVQRLRAPPVLEAASVTYERVRHRRRHAREYIVAVNRMCKLHAGQRTQAPRQPARQGIRMAGIASLRSPSTRAYSCAVPAHVFSANCFELFRNQPNATLWRAGSKHTIVFMLEAALMDALPDPGSLANITQTSSGADRPAGRTRSRHAAGTSPHSICRCAERCEALRHQLLALGKLKQPLAEDCHAV